MRRSRRLVVTWTALLAVLLTALMPTLSHAFGRQGPATWTEVCTSTGARKVALDDGGSARKPVPGAAHLLDHCPCCNLHLGGVAPPPAPARLPLPLLQGELQPAAFLHAGRTLPVWSSAQPRAPPVSA